MPRYSPLTRVERKAEGRRCDPAFGLGKMKRKNPEPDYAQIFNEQIGNARRVIRFVSLISVDLSSTAISRSPLASVSSCLPLLPFLDVIPLSESPDSSSTRRLPIISGPTRPSPVNLPRERTKLARVSPLPPCSPPFATLTRRRRRHPPRVFFRATIKARLARARARSKN